LGVGRRSGAGRIRLFQVREVHSESRADVWSRRLRVDLGTSPGDLFLLVG
jgi:hypothetical protein